MISADFSFSMNDRIIVLSFFNSEVFGVYVVICYVNFF